MRLADFILKNVEPILAEWEVFARGIWPGGAPDPVILRDDAEGIIREAAAQMKLDQTPAQRSDKSKGRGDRGPDGVRLNRASAAHGVGRVASGFDLAALVGEYRALRASVVRLWRDGSSNCDPNDLDDLTRFNESIDQSLTGAMLAFTGHVDRDRRVVEVEQAERGRELRGLNDALLVSSVRQHELTEQADHATAASREAKEQAETANRAKDRFLAVLSHELRTPLTPVVMTLAAIEIDPDLSFKFREDLAMVRRNIDLEVKLIDDLLDLSRITSGKLRLHLQSVHAHDVLSHVLRSSVSEASGKRLRVRQELQASNDRVSVDPARLQQVFWNLVRNAVKFTPDGGEVAVRTWNAEANGHLHVEVRDTGIGIAPDVLPRIFDAFEQGDLRMTRQFGGLGLGLAIAKAVVEMHGGTITASSEGRNRGAAFEVAIETDSASSSEGARSSASDSASNQILTRSRVLLVEDHLDTARVLAKLLRGSGYDVKTANSAASALQLAAVEPFDVVVSDIGLPDATGHELMEQIRDRYGIKGIALSGYGMEDDVRKSRDAGFVDHVIKPVNLAQLEAVIERVIGTRDEGRT